MLFKYILNKIIFSVHLKFCKQYFIIGRAAGQSTSYAYYLKNVVQNKKSQWFIFFCAILYNRNLKQKNKMPNTFSMQCLPLLFRVLKAKEIKKKRNIVSTNELRNYFYLHFWFNKIFIKINYWCIVFVFFEKEKKKEESTASNSDNGVLCLAPSLTSFFPNYTITESFEMRL